MKRNTIVSVLAAALVALVAATAAVAGGSHGTTLYRFVGQLQSAPSGSSLTISVQSGNRPALRALLGQSQVQTFATGSSTVFLRWSNGIPTVVSIGDLAQNDYVAINIRAHRGASLGELEATARPHRGRPRSRPPLAEQAAVPVQGQARRNRGRQGHRRRRGGNHRALRLLIGQSAQQTFTTGAGTVFLHWERRIPTVTTRALKLGDRIVDPGPRPRGSTLAEVEATPARRVADREPASQEATQNAQA